MSIKLKLILIISGMLIVICILATIFFTWQVKTFFTNQAQQNIENKINYSQELVNFYFSRIQDNTTSIVNDPVTAEALITKDPQKLQYVSDKMTNMVDAINIIETMALMEVNGSTCTNRTAAKASLSIVGKDFSDREYCKGIIKTKEPYLSAAYIGAVTKHPNLTMVIPVKNPAGEMIGFVSGVTDPSELRGYLWDLQQNGSYTVILDRNNKPLIDTRSKIDKISESSDEETLISQNKAKQGFLILNNYFIGYHKYDSFTIIYAEPTLIMQNTLNSINSSVVTYVLLIIIFTIVFLFFIISKLSSRLKVVTNAAKKISEGNMNIKIDEKYEQGKDEISVLATAFNQMLTKLHDFYGGLEKKVAERTKELEEKSTKLEESEAKLQKTLEVSEQTNKLMVGRELEMMKLKEKIKELENK